MQDQMVTSCCLLSPSSLLCLGSRRTLNLLTLGSAWNDVFILFFHEAIHRYTLQNVQKPICVFVKGLTICHTNEFVQSHFSDGRIIIRIVLYDCVYRGSRVYPKGRGSRVYPNGRGSR